MVLKIKDFINIVLYQYKALLKMEPTYIKHLKTIY